MSFFVDQTLPPILFKLNNESNVTLENALLDYNPPQPMGAIDLPELPEAIQPRQNIIEELNFDLCNRINSMTGSIQFTAQFQETFSLDGQDLEETAPSLINREKSFDSMTQLFPILSPLTHRVSTIFFNVYTDDESNVQANLDVTVVEKRPSIIFR